VARGSIIERRRKDGSPIYAIKYRTADGTQVFRTVGRSRRQAERELTAALAAVDRGQLRTVSRETFAEYAERWLADHRSRVERSTAIDYDNTLRNHLLPAFGAIRLSAIRSEHVRAYVAGKLDGTARVANQPAGKGGRIQRVLSPKTINNQLGLLALILGHAVADGLLISNPASSRDSRRPLKLKVPHREQDYLRPDEVPRYLAACSPFWRPRAMTLVLTGCRIGELLALEWVDVDWGGRAIVIRRALKHGKLIGSTKGDETGRRLDLGPSLTQALRDHQAVAAEYGAATRLVFPAPTGGYDNAKRLLDRENRPTLERAGLRLSIVNHELRHTAAAVWLSLGFPMEYVRRQMGHRDIATTIRNYGHLERTLIPDAALRTEAAVLGRETVSPGDW
jgi:integrase